MTQIYRAERPRPTTSNASITIFDGVQPPRTVQFSAFHKNVITFGRDPAGNNDILLTSHYVGRSHHGRFIFQNNHWWIEDCKSTNGIRYNDAPVARHALADGDFIRIDESDIPTAEGVLFVFTADGSEMKWKFINPNQYSSITIGRDQRCAIVLPHISVSNLHARITKENGVFYITDCHSSNGTMVNNVRIYNHYRLYEKDIINITNTKLIFSKNYLAWCYYRKGVSVDARDIVIVRGSGRKAKVTSNHVTMNIRPGELVSIVGGSGAGKSTILNCMCGYLKPKSGQVFINGVDLYRNFNTIRNIIGYVPQSDIVYDNLTLYDMLKYSAELRLPKDTSPKEKQAAIERTIATVGLTEKKDAFIRSLSGGQRKRASIAVELLADPNLLFLDEPCSGLDPGTERSLMKSLREMADAGKTIILVTHSTLQLGICDKVAFMGRNGNLDFFGSEKDALAFFGVPDVVDIYQLINDQPERWRNYFNHVRGVQMISNRGQEVPHSPVRSNRRQLNTLVARYIKLVMNDRKRLLLLAIQAIALPFLISLVKDGNEWEQYDMTKSLLFCLSCCAFWIGMLSSIQEICKERTILKREYMTGQSLTIYLISKIVVLSLLSIVLGLLMTLSFQAMVGMPEDGVLFSPFAEITVTTILTAISASALGLLVSCFVKNGDRAMAVAPFLLMPQILFSGLIFKLDSDVLNAISAIVTCRWSMEGYGTTANLNDLITSIQQKGLPIEHEFESAYEFTGGHLIWTWIVLLIMTVVCIAIARAALSSIRKQNA